MIKSHKMSATHHQPQQIWAASSRRYPFRRQTSLAVESTAPPSTNVVTKRPLFKKQLSLDQHSGRLPLARVNTRLTTVTPVPSTAAISYWDVACDEKSNESSLRIMAAINKKRSSPPSRLSDVVKNPDLCEILCDKSVGNNDSPVVPSPTIVAVSANDGNDKESKININIDMGYVHDTDGCLSDSDPTSTTNECHQAKINDESSLLLAKPDVDGNGNSAPGNTTMGLRRAQFQNSRQIETILEAPTRRPPLVRAMSAPIRPMVDPKVLKRKPKRKSKLQREQSEATTIDTFLKADSRPTAQSGKQRLRKTPAAPPRTQSAMGCEVETLMSMLSSGSDSEKEENVSNEGETLLPTKAPTLRKTVSFQEDDFQNIPKDFPLVYRRASIAPLAARIRAKRPPTAPPGSIYMARKMAAEKLSPDRKKEPSDREGTVVKCELTITQVKIDTFIDYPTDVKSPKERECYRLFKKMSDKGLNVSYDTVLRGMLTPTELRVIQKQREIEKAKLLQQQASLAEENDEGAPPSTGNEVKVVQCRKAEA